MKKHILYFSMLACMAFFGACTTRVDLYADYKDIPVIYGLLDASQDTNFVRINRAFSSNNDHPINANEVALIADSCNYPGKLRAYIVEYKSVYGNNYDPTGRTIELDTMTIHNKQEGVFYSPDQKVYWTNESLNVSASGSKYKYKLYVHKGNDTITSETDIVGGEDFRIIATGLNFSAEPSDKTGKIKFKAAENAVFYDMKIAFYYEESINGGPFVEKQVSYSVGTKSKDDLSIEDGSFYMTYGENVLFRLLTDAIGGDTVTDPNHPNVVRHIRFVDPAQKYPMQIFLSAGGEELYNYIQVNMQSGFSQTVPDYTNVKGGYGVFSSRVNLVKPVTISSRTQSDLFGKPWGFVTQ